MLRSFLSLCIFLLASAALCAEDAPKLSISFKSDVNGRPARIAVLGLDEPTLAVCVKRKLFDAARIQVIGETEEETARNPSVIGHWAVRGKELVFEPRFPFAVDTAYRVTVDSKRLIDPETKISKPYSFDVRTPKKDQTPVTKVTHIYPTRDKLPENQLRFYIHFSNPMSRGEAYANIKLLDGKGKPINDVFLQLEEELWDPAQTRFTLLFDPGRVKRGLKPREDLGPTLEEGKRYTLVVMGQWHDGEGRLLVDKEFRKEFAAGPPDNQPIDPKNWKLTPPSFSTKAPLLVRFPKPLDRALLERVIWIVDHENKKVPGAVEVAEEETLWKFIPKHAWQPGTYRLMAETILEDLAANRIGRAFEVDVFRPVTKEVEAKTVEIEFRIK